MAETDRLALPLMAGEQANKHVTHNEALLLLDGAAQLVLTALDVAVPPTAPAAGTLVSVAAGASGAFAGHEGELAIWTAGGWRFLMPREGWRGWDAAVGAECVFAGGAWRPSHHRLAGLGVGTDADATNRLAVRSEAALFTAVEAGSGGNGDVRLTLNKEAAENSATVIFQSGWSGRAEIGLAGNDAFAFKVSADGSAWETALMLAPGMVTAGGFLGLSLSSPTVVAGALTCATGLVAPQPESGSADTIEAIAGGFEGALLVLLGTDGATLTFANNAGNLRLGANRVLSSAVDTLTLVRRASQWVELAFADNG